MARVQKLALSESDRLAKLVPDKVTPDKKAGEALSTSAQGSRRNWPNGNPLNQLIRNTLKYAEKLRRLDSADRVCIPAV